MQRMSARSCLVLKLAEHTELVKPLEDIPSFALRHQHPRRPNITVRISSHRATIPTDQTDQTKKDPARAYATPRQIHQGHGLSNGEHVRLLPPALAKRTGQLFQGGVQLTLEFDTMFWNQSSG